MQQPFDSTDPRHLLSDEQCADLIRQVEGATAPPASAPSAVGSSLGRGHTPKQILPCLICGRDVELDAGYRNALCEICEPRFEPIHVMAVNRACATIAEYERANANREMEKFVAALNERGRLIATMEEHLAAKQRIIEDVAKSHARANLALLELRRILALCASTAFVLAGLSGAIWLCWRYL